MQRWMHNTKFVVTALCLAAQAMLLGHHVLVEHTLCGEHGALVHGELAHGEGHADHGAVAVGDVAEVSGAAVSAGDEQHAEDHEHCAVASDRRKAIRNVAPVLAAVAFQVSAPAVLVSQGLVARRAVHWTAPKTSPPVV